MNTSREFKYHAEIHPACIIVWPDDDRCWGDEIHEYDWKSDDYEILFPNTPKHTAMMKEML